MAGTFTKYMVGFVLVHLVGCGSTAHTDPGFIPLGEGEGDGGAGAAPGAGGASSITSSGSTGSGGSHAKGPPHPIVFAHGFFGFEQFAGLDFATYFYGVQQHLAAHGEHYVYTPAVDPFNSSEVRGAQLAAAIEDILAATGHDKVNIVGHSQGGLDARVVAHDHPEMVASVITLQTPHFGTPIADIAMKLVDDPSLKDVLDWIVQTIGAPLYDEIGQATSIAASIAQFSAPEIQVFNTTYTDQPGVWYASFAGRSDHHHGGNHCTSIEAPPWVTAFDDETDPIDPFFAVTEALIDGGFTNPYPNDGLVRVADAKWGVFLGCLPADHLDMVGHLFGDGPGGGNDWDHLQFYVSLVGLLRDRGL